MACHALFLGGMVAIAPHGGLGALYHAGLAAAAGLVIHQYRLIRERDRERCFRAFLNNNWVGAAVFAGIAFDRLVYIPVGR